MNPLDLQGLAGGTGSTLQRLVLPDLGLEHRLHRDGSLGCPGNLRLRLCAIGNETGLSAKENKLNRDGSLRNSPLAFSSQRRASTREASAFSFRSWASTREASATLEASLPSSASHKEVRERT